MRVSKYCLLDRDYHTEEQVHERIEEAEKKGIRLKIWNRKELENYLLVPTAIQCALRRNARRKPVPSQDDIQAKLLEIAELLKAEVLDGIADELPRLQKGLTPSAVMNLAKELLEKEWQSPAKRLAKISGKAALTALNQWTQSEYKVSFTNAAVAIETRSEEIDSEITGFLSAVEYNEAF